MKLSKEQLLEMYKTMLRIRLFEEDAIKMFNKGLMRGPMHVYIGQEACATGACATLRDEDYITSTHRGHGHCIAKGGDLKKMAAELLGRATGYSKGKGGSMHIADPEIGILGANGIVAGGLGIATGAAMSAKMRGTDQVTICFFGDGATNEGLFHESLNMAAIWDLPVVYFCENNLYGLTGRSSELLAVEDVVDRAKSYNMASEIVDGNDVIAVYEAVMRAVERAKNGEGPTLVEAKTYRWEGHYVGDPCVYRPKGEAEEWKKRCAIARLRKHLIEEQGLKAEEMDQVDADVAAEVEEAFEYAQESPEPELEVIFEDLYA